MNAEARPRSESMARYLRVRDAGYMLPPADANRDDWEAWKLSLQSDPSKVFAVLEGDWHWVVATAEKMVASGDVGQPSMRPPHIVQPCGGVI